MQVPFSMMVRVHGAIVRGKRFVRGNVTFYSTHLPGGTYLTSPEITAYHSKYSLAPFPTKIFGKGSSTFSYERSWVSSSDGGKHSSVELLGRAGLDAHGGSRDLALRR